MLRYRDASTILSRRGASSRSPPSSPRVVYLRTSSFFFRLRAPRDPLLPSTDRSPLAVPSVHHASSPLSPGACQLACSAASQSLGLSFRRMRWEPNSYPRGHPFCGAYSFTPADSRVAFFRKFRMRLGSASKDAAAPSAYSLPAFAACDGGSGGGEEGRVGRVERTRRGGGERKTQGGKDEAAGFFADTSARIARRGVSIARASRRGTVAGEARGGTETRGAHLAAGLAEEHGRLAQHLLRLGPHGR